MHDTEFVGVVPREIAILQCEREIVEWCVELLEITNNGLHDSMSVNDWIAVRQLAKRKDLPL